MHESQSHGGKTDPLMHGQCAPSVTCGLCLVNKADFNFSLPNLRDA
jgi:hypothetical protein